MPSVLTFQRFQKSDMHTDNDSSPPPELEDERRNEEPKSSDADDTRGMAGPTRSVYNLVYEADDDDILSDATSEYLEEIDLPLPVIADSESSRWSRFGQCCDCCDTCIRRHVWVTRCECGWIKNACYYFVLNLLVMSFFLFVMYMTHVNYNKSPEVPPFQQLKFKYNQYPGVSMIPSMENLPYTPISIIWYGHEGNDTYNNRRERTYVNAIDKLIYHNKKACAFSFRCEYDISSWGPCEKSDYGFSDDAPCIYLKLNRLTMWLPDEYHQKSNIPDDVPKALRAEINVTSPRIWVHCEGETPFDKEKLGKVKYFPGPYFNTSHFPLSSQKETNPVIAIKLTNYKRKRCTIVYYKPRAVRFCVNALCLTVRPQRGTRE